MTNLHRFLTKLDACEEAVEWSNGKTLSEAWQSCERADWMLWLVGRMAGREGWPSRQQIVLVFCLIAEDVLPIYEKNYPNDTRVRKCIEVTRAWARGEATIEQVREARNTTTTTTTTVIAAAAAYAAAAYAYAAAAYAAYAADAAAGVIAATAAAYAADAYAAAARFSKLKEYADLVRRELKIPEEVNTI